MQDIVTGEAMPAGISRSPMVYLPLSLPCFGWSSELLGETSLVKHLKDTYAHVSSTFSWLHCSAWISMWEGFCCRGLSISLCALLHSFNFRILFGVNTKAHTCYLFNSVISSFPSTDFKGIFFFISFFCSMCGRVQGESEKYLLNVTLL